MKKFFVILVALIGFGFVANAQTQGESQENESSTFCKIVGKVVGSALEYGSVVGAGGFEREPDDENAKAIEKETTEECDKFINWLFSGSSTESESTSSTESESTSSEDDE